MKNILAIILTLAMMTTLFAGAFSFGAAADKAPLIGDADGDDDVTVSDALITLRVAAKLATINDQALPVYDVWNDGSVGVDDALGVLRRAVGLSDSFGRVGVELEFTPNTDSTDVTQEMLDRSIITTKGTERVAKVMEKAASGKPLTIVTLGGSITAGSLASTENARYNNIITSWWQNSFPQSQVRLINSGIGATGSFFGVHRLQRDVLKYHPDLLILEYAVNDNKSGTLESYEAIVRRVLTDSPDTAIVCLFMTTADAEDVQGRLIPVSEYYSLPTVSYKNAVAPVGQTAPISFGDISPDGVHPNDRGFRIVSCLLDSYFEGVKAVYEDYRRIIPEIPSDFMTTDRYMNAQLYWCGEGIKPTTLGGWKVDETFTYYDFRSSWTVSSSKKPMKFTVEGKEISILYMRYVDSANTGKIKVAVDGVTTATIDNSFAGGWGDYLIEEIVYTSSESAEHELSLTNTGGKFRVVAIMVA